MEILTRFKNHRLLGRGWEIISLSCHKFSADAQSDGVVTEKMIFEQKVKMSMNIY